MTPEDVERELARLRPLRPSPDARARFLRRASRGTRTARIGLVAALLLCAASFWLILRSGSREVPALQEDGARAIQELISGLASDDIERRELATRLLIEKGEEARSPLEKAEAGADPETRGRIRRLLDRLDFGILAANAPWTLEDWARRLDAAFSLPSPPRRAALRELGMKLSDEDFAKAEERTQNKSGESIFQACLEQWVLTNPKSAARWAYAQTVYVPLEKKDDLRELLARVVVLWAKADAEEARAWVKGLPEGPARTKATRELDRRR